MDYSVKLKKVFVLSCSHGSEDLTDLIDILT